MRLALYILLLLSPAICGAQASVSHQTTLVTGSTSFTCTTTPINNIGDSTEVVVLSSFPVGTYTVTSIPPGDIYTVIPTATNSDIATLLCDRQTQSSTYSLHFTFSNVAISVVLLSIKNTVKNPFDGGNNILGPILGGAGVATGSVTPTSNDLVLANAMTYISLSNTVNTPYSFIYNVSFVGGANYGYCAAQIFSASPVSTGATFVVSTTVTQGGGAIIALKSIIASSNNNTWFYFYGYLIKKNEDILDMPDNAFIGIAG